MHVRPYLTVFRMRFALMLQYRAAALAGFGTQLWWGFIKVMVFAAFFRSTLTHQPMNLAQAVTYVWLGQAFLALFPWLADPEVAEMVRTGNVAYDRLRPLDTYFFWYVRAMAWMVARVVPRCIMMFAFAGLVVPLLGMGDWRLRMPAGAGSAALFVAAMIVVVLLSSAFVMLINLVCVVTLSDRGANGFMVPLVLVLSGSIVPLQFFPNWLQPFLFFQPFAGLVDIPYRIYFGGLTGWIALVGLAQMLAWTIVLVFGGHRMMTSAMSRLQVQGG
ncbi:MAG: ABC transporter permease [Candidatus Binataceae bacterium]